MTTVEFITALFSQIDNHLYDLPKHPQAALWPSEVVTLGLLAHLRQDKHGFPLIPCRYAAMGSPSCWLALQR
jgi:hypothetical protein